MTAKIRKAIAFAMKKHEGQIRKGSGLPYITHPISVFALVKKFKESKNWEDLCCAALLHDTLEDTDTTFEELVREFGVLVATIVFECTNDEKEIKRIGKEAYMKKKVTGISSYALFLKLCDQFDNLSDRPSRKLYVRITELILHIECHCRLSASHLKIIAEIREYINYNPLPEEVVWHERVDCIRT